MRENIFWHALPILHKNPLINILLNEIPVRSYLIFSIKIDDILLGKGSIFRSCWKPSLDWVFFWPQKNAHFEALQCFLCENTFWHVLSIFHKKIINQCKLKLDGIWSIFRSCQIPSLDWDFFWPPKKRAFWSLISTY